MKARPGAFLLTGSARLLGMRRLPDALVGRSETIDLWPFSQGEIDGQPDGFIDAIFAADSPQDLVAAQRVAPPGARRRDRHNSDRPGSERRISGCSGPRRSPPRAILRGISERPHRSRSRLRERSETTTSAISGRCSDGHQIAFHLGIALYAGPTALSLPAEPSRPSYLCPLEDTPAAGVLRHQRDAERIPLTRRADRQMMKRCESQ